MVKKSDQQDPELNRLIDKNLKRAFDTLANEPVPDRFTSLLDQL
ncbi:MAG: RNA polymerase subunit sigma-70, partial [Silicimonas sp.]|nr:RNA polymerase subunit sigma-70 [Silicimonas sp.]